MNPLSLNLLEVAELTGGMLAAEHRTAGPFTRVSAFGEADATSIVFAGDGATLGEALSTSAGLILTTFAS